MEGALDYLPADDKFAKTVRECMRLYDENPEDWHDARAFIKEKYYDEEPSFTKTLMVLWVCLPFYMAMGILKRL